MATQIGVITALIGTATVTALDGSVRQLQLGDKVYANDLITTGAGSAIEVEFADGSVMDMGRDSQTVLNNQVYDPSAAGHSVAQADANVDAIQHAILAGQDPTKIASPTAAGNGEATGDQVHAPVYVDYLAPEVTPTAGFGTTGPTNDFHQVPGGPGYNQSLVTTTTTTNTVAPELIVGSNASDNGESTTPFVVSTSTPNSGVINGNSNGDILVGDSGGVGTNIDAQNYNIALVLDTSHSLFNNLDAYKAAVISYLNELHSYQSGDVSIGIINFSSTATSASVFDVSSNSGLQNAIDHVNGITIGTNTNYEAALSSAANWLSSLSGGSAINQTVFVSDGQPNQAIDANGNVFTSYDLNRLIGEITGTYVSANPGSHDRLGALDANDSHSEVGALQDLGHVYAIGIGVAEGSTDAQVLNIVASDNYISIDDINSLGSTMMSLSPTQTLDGLGSDVISGGAGDDIIFGDSVNTDALAQAQGLSTPSGDGWDVFTRLENGEGSNSNWTRADTIQYIQNNHQQLGQESLNADGSGRTGGNDQLSGGQGNDLIYGQEGNDIISGGAGNDLISGGSGNDTMSGGSGNDTFTWAANDAGTTSAPAQDTITDFGNGDVLKLGDLLVGEQSGDITNYLKVSENGSNVVINVSPDGSGTATGTTENIVLQNTSLADLGAGSYNTASQQSEIINSLIHNGHISVDHS